MSLDTETQLQEAASPQTVVGRSFSFVRRSRGHMMLLRLCIAVAMLAALPVRAQFSGCTDSAALEVAATSGYPGDAIACAVVPGANKGIVAIGRSESSDSTLAVLIYERGVNRVLARHVDREPGFLGRMLDGLTIDRRSYAVAPNAKAFGVRARLRLNSWDPSEELFLYVQDGQELKAILSGFTVYSFNGQIGHTGCQGEDLERKSTLHPSKTLTSGYYDLTVTTINRESFGEMIGDRCKITRTPPFASNETLRFRDGTYQIQER